MKTLSPQPASSRVQFRRTAVLPSPDSSETSLHQIGVWFAILYVVVVYGRLGETFLRIPLVAFMTGALALAICLVDGGAARAGKTRSGIFFLVITVWLIAAIPFSLWPGGSVQLIRTFWLKNMAVFFLIAGMVTTLKHYRLLMGGLAATMMLVVAALALFGVSQEGRLELNTASLANPNDTASHLLIGVPFVMLFANPKSLRGWLFLGLTGAVLAGVLKTGSRGGLLALFMLLIYRFIRGSALTRASLLACVFAGVLMLPHVVTVESIERYRSMFGDMAADAATSRQVEYAEGSKENRIELLKQSVIATFLNPIFGVGPGQFSGFMADTMIAAGAPKGMWSQTHNSFTQMSSEGGLLPGLLFVWITIRTFRNGRWVWKMTAQIEANDTMKKLADWGEALTTAVCCFVAAGFFGNYAYAVYLPILAGCGEALLQITQRELQFAGTVVGQEQRVQPKITRAAVVRPRLVR